MAKMYGKLRKMWYGQCKRGCCYMPASKSSIKREEMTLVLREAEDEMYDERDEAHKNGICYDPKTKMYGCDYCYDNSDPADNSDLDEVPGVWCNVDWRNE